MVFLLNIWWYLLPDGKWFDIRLRNNLPMFVLTSLLKGGLNHIILRCLFLFCPTFDGFGGLYFKLAVCPLALSALLYI